VSSVFSTPSGAGEGDASVARSEASFRYAAVFLLMMALLVFVIVAPAGDATRAGVCALQGAALLVVVATSRVRRRTRRTRSRVVAVVAALFVAAIAVGVVPASVVAVVNGALAISVMVALVDGLLRLVREQGVNAQAVAGALTIYVLTGLVFAWIVSLIADLGSTKFFTGGTDGTEGDRVYYSFTVLTTTGFGDYTAATAVGHALAVVEMLLGQLYLVTVIGVLVGAVAGRSGR
jgi:hypothetical protein